MSSVVHVPVLILLSLLLLLRRWLRPPLLILLRILLVLLRLLLVSFGNALAQFVSDAECASSEDSITDEAHVADAAEISSKSSFNAFPLFERRCERLMDE